MPIHIRRKPSRPKRIYKNLFSDETNLYLIRFLRGKNTAAETAVMSGGRDLQLELAAAVREKCLPLFWSVLLHFFVLLLFALIFMPVIRLEPIDILSGIADVPAVPELPLNPISGVQPQPEPLPPVPEPAQETEIKPQNDNTAPGLNLSGRSWNSRQAMLANGGGNGQSDEAVLAGLRWLVKVQQPDGSWALANTPFVRFPQAAPKSREDTAAATAMALLAFQGYGIAPETENKGMPDEFRRPVQRGWQYLLKQQQENGSFFVPKSAPDNHRFYTHGLCTAALCDLLAMTGGDGKAALREPAQRAVNYCVQYQSVGQGGWRYHADRFSPQSDISVTGWIVFAMKTGQAAGLDVPPQTFRNAAAFLDAMETKNQYRYRAEEPEPRISMTAEALFCRMLLGWRRDNPRLAAGVKLMGQSPPAFDDHYRRDVYYWFFASQTLFHYGGEEWETWNGLLRNQLVKYQDKAGTETGSWNPRLPVRDAWGIQYGRLYTTCLSLYILETYYRYNRLGENGREETADGR
ncbi:MAG: terpene cyclase/mutase family protein [Planctomycetaceae bacterium]|nr:terpene cyclase/mutase family protein [Planctomycetaceae bacterium]